MPALFSNAILRNVRCIVGIDSPHPCCAIVQLVCAICLILPSCCGERVIPARTAFCSGNSRGNSSTPSKNSILTKRTVHTIPARCLCVSFAQPHRPCAVAHTAVHPVLVPCAAICSTSVRAGRTDRLRIWIKSNLRHGKAAAVSRALIGASRPLAGPPRVPSETAALPRRPIAQPAPRALGLV